MLLTQRSGFSLTRATWIFKVTAGEAKYTPAPLISGWTTHAKLMQTNEGEVQVRSSGTPLASFWDSKHAQMWIHRVCESVHITWNKTNPHTPELQPWALAFYPSLSNFPGGIRKEITPPRAWRRAMYSRGLAESTEQWMWSPVKHRTLTHTSWTKFDFHIL